jgi:iron complex outermembrane receptor protein
MDRGATHVIRSFKVTVTVVGTLAILAPQPVAARWQDPDSIVRIEPVLVRILKSTIGTGEAVPVSVITGPELTRGTASAFLEEALRAVPGVQIQNRFNLAVGERIAIRGFGSRSQFGVRGVRVLVDGIPATLPDGQATLDHLDLAGLGRVEALRGPSASLYGNAAGGVLHFRTLDPALTPASVSVRSTSGTHGLWTIQGNATGTSGDLGYRVGFSRMEYDGFRRDPIADDGSVYGAATRAVVNATMTLPIANGTLRVVANGLDLDAENPGSLNPADFDAGARSARGFNITSAATKAVQQGQIGTSWSGVLGSTQADFAMWGVRRELVNPIPGRVIDLTRNAGGLRALLQRTRGLGQGAFTYAGGFEAELQRDGRLNSGNDAGQRDGLRLDQIERVRGAGLFVQGRYDTDGGISVLAGLRYDNIGFAVEDQLVGGGNPDDSGDRTMDAFSPSIGVVFGGGGDVEVFGNMARSFETPTTTELANDTTGAGGFNPDLEPQLGLSFEAGARARISPTWRLEGSVFRTKLEDGLVSFEVGNRTYFQNAGESSYTGVEVSLDGRLVPDLSLRVAYTGIDATFDDFVTGDGDFSGNKIPGLAPKRLDGLAVFDRGVGFVELRALWQDAVPVDDGGTTSGEQYFLADARIGLDRLTLGGMEVAPFFGVANLFDEVYVASVVPNAFGNRYFEPGPGRTYRIGLGITWGG